MLAPDLARHLASGPLDDLGVTEVGGRIRVWEGRCRWSTFGPEGEMLFVTLFAGCWVGVSGVGVGVVGGCADVVNKMSNEARVTLHGAGVWTTGDCVVLIIRDGK